SPYAKQRPLSAWEIAPLGFTPPAAATGGVLVGKYRATPPSPGGSFNDPPLLDPPTSPRRQSPPLLHPGRRTGQQCWLAGTGYRIEWVGDCCAYGGSEYRYDHSQVKPRVRDDTVIAEKRDFSRLESSLN